MPVPLQDLHRLGLLPERCIDCDSRRCVDFACRAPKPNYLGDLTVIVIVLNALHDLASEA